MKFHHRHNRRGFTLMELAIVLGVFGAIVASLWTVVSLNRQRVRVQQSLDAVAYTVDAVRSLYGSQASIVANMDTLVPALIKNGGIYKNYVRSSTAACNGTTDYYADGPWTATTADTCGTFRACAWQYKTTKKCVAGAIATGQQYFAVEFTQLDFGSCVALAAGVYPTHPPGLVDVYINASTASSGVMESTNPQLPAPTSWAETNCTTGSTANVIDFVYRLRPPLS